MDAERIDSDQYSDETPEGIRNRWQLELDSANKDIEKWHKRGELVLKRFRDERGETDDGTKLNLYTSNVQTLQALLFGKTPQVDVARKFGDPNDDLARVGGETMERLLNCDIERDSDSYKRALTYALMDRLNPGAGIVRLRYVAEFGVEEVPAKIDPVTGVELAPGFKREVKTFEDVEVDHVNWKDFRWSPARVWHEVRWVAFKTDMGRRALIKRFGEKGKTIPLIASKRTDQDDSSAKQNDPWSRACVWEIWDKETETAYWIAEGFNQILDVKENPLQLDGFFPMPEPMLANITTSSLVPVPDYVLAQDLYTEIDELSAHIRLLTEAVKVSGVYDETLPGLDTLLSGPRRNKLIPVANWPSLTEKGGMQGAINFLPIDMVVNALTVLTQQRTERIALLFQVTGFSDIMRGQAMSNTTATEQAIKARFASVRVQAMQDEFARFASDVQRIKAEIISKHFDPQTIIERSNVLHTPDAQMAMQAVQLIKSKWFLYRVSVRPENVSITDYAALKGERTEFLQALTGFIQTALPAAQAMPGSLPELLECLKWGLAGFKGSSEIEGVLDRAIAKATEMASQPQQQKPDPKLQAIALKGKIEAANDERELRSDLVRTQAEVQADKVKQVTKFQIDQAAANTNAEREMGLAAVRQTTGGD